MADYIRKTEKSALEEKETIRPTQIKSFVMVKHYRGGFGVTLEP